MLSAEQGKMRQRRRRDFATALALLAIWFGVKGLPAGAQVRGDAPLWGNVTAPGSENRPTGEQDGEETGVDDPDAILDLDIDQLARTDVVVPSMDTEVTSVTRTESTVGRSPAAIFVITPEMIRRSGATSIPEVLRMVPGLEVARVTASQWAVTSRGFNSRFGNKLLVQIDGRSIYSQTFSGVFWEANHVMLQDVERIEVIRGPGATVWGSNAVNGVINIITKSAKDTQGVLLSGGAGSEERGFVDARYGGAIGDHFDWRVYAKQFERDRGFSAPLAPTDDWRMTQTGFRTDWEPDGRDTITVQGDYFSGAAGATFPEQIADSPFQRNVSEDVPLVGGNVLGRWSRDLGDGRGWALQCYYTRFLRHLSSFKECLDTFDVDFQREFPLGRRHKLVWGGGYRHNRDHLNGGFAVSYEPDRRATDLFSYFVQDAITLREDRLYLTVGSKFEHNDFTSFEYQPSARLLLAPDSRRAAWAAISRAVRTPSRSDDDMRDTVFNIPMGPPPPVFVRLTGDRSVQAEDLLAYEIGYRAQPRDDFSWDVTAFFNQYEDLIVFPPSAAFPGPPPPLIWPWFARNAMDGETYGFELTATWQVNPCWQVTGSYSYLRMHLHADAGVDSRVEAPENESPRNQAYFRSSWDLKHDLEFDLVLRYVDSLPADRGIGLTAIPSYVAMDVRLGWQAGENLEVAVVGQNLLDDHHPEFPGKDSFPTEVQSGVYGSVTWQY